jgi:hypothetical protein
LIKKGKSMKRPIILIITFFIGPNLLFAQIPNAVSNIKTAQYNSNYYRVSVKGFICNRETYDDMLERDGKRDEIYLTSFSFMVNNQNRTIPSTVVRLRSRTMGDIHARALEERRVLAGSAAGGLGGIQTGDQIPDVEPWKNNAKASGELLPFVLWEGNLIPNSDYVVIHPGIMEWDGAPDFLTNFWHNSFAGQVVRTVSNFATLPFRAFTANTSNNDSEPGVWPAPQVQQEFGSVFYKIDLNSLNPDELRNYFTLINKPGDRPIGIDEKSIYNPVQIRIDNRIAGMLCNKDFGYGKGIVPIRYKDDDSYNGDYTLFIAIENIIDPAEKNRINVRMDDVFDPIAFYSFRSALSVNKEADILNGGTVDNTFVVLNDAKGLQSQKWRLRRLNNYYTITNTYNSLVLDLLNQNNINGSNIVTSRSNNSATQQWLFQRYADGSWIIRNLGTNESVAKSVSV